MLTLFNSLTRTKEVFEPIVPGKIGIYVCGNTVYDHCHLGHARSMVVFDVIVRFLRASQFEVTYVRNITDIDDKIIQRAKERGISIDALTGEFIDAQNEDIHTLGILPPDKEPKATEHVASIIHLIERLMDKGYAYVADNGDVCFPVESFKHYGQLSHQDIDALLSGARVEVVAEKKSPLDFVLWKKAKENEPAWGSPWGEGRPGWHIECSAMAIDALGAHFDIHGGGLDLQFPHHENEIAQAEAATEQRFANYWLHVGLLQVNNEKMAKSLGNFITIKEACRRYHPEVIRYFLLSAHYRSSVNYTEDTMHHALRSLTRLYQAIKDFPQTKDASLADEYVQRFRNAMNDDFNTPEALAVLFDLSHALNKNPSAVLADTLRHLAGQLGLLQDNPTAFLQAGLDSEKKAYVENKIAERIAARSAKDWALADSIRKQLALEGIELEDGPTGTTWRRLD